MSSPSKAAPQHSIEASPFTALMYSTGGSGVLPFSPGMARHPQHHAHHPQQQPYLPLTASPPGRSVRQVLFPADAKDKDGGDSEQMAVGPTPPATGPVTTTAPSGGAVQQAFTPSQHKSSSTSLTAFTPPSGSSVVGVPSFLSPFALPSSSPALPSLATVLGDTVTGLHKFRKLDLLVPSPLTAEDHTVPAGGSPPPGQNENILLHTQDGYLRISEHDTLQPLVKQARELLLRQQQQQQQQQQLI